MTCGTSLGFPDARRRSLEPFANAFIQSRGNKRSIAVEAISHCPSGHNILEQLIISGCSELTLCSDSFWFTLG